MRTTFLILALAALLATLAAAPASAAPKPGFLPGTWVGTGTITGSSTDGPFTTHFNGGITFSLKVDAQLRVSGSGTWRLDMLGSENALSADAVDSSMQGTAAARFAGSSTMVSFSGTQTVVGEIRGYGTKRPVSFTRPLTGLLQITRAGKCRVVGATRLPDGVELAWSAVLKGGRCRT